MSSQLRRSEYLTGEFYRWIKGGELRNLIGEFLTFVAERIQCDGKIS